MTWRAKVLQIAGRLAHSMVDDRFKVAPPGLHMPHLAWFGVYCRIDPGTAFWNPLEQPKLDAIELELIALCDQFAGGQAAYLHRLDTRGLREYYVYCGHAAHLEEVLPRLRASHPDYRLEYDITVDADWAHYRTALAQLDEEVGTDE